MKYRYDADGNLAQLTYPDGSQISYSRDKGLLKQTVLANDETVDWQDYRWFAPAKVSFPGAEQTIEYDALLRPVDIQVSHGNSQLMQRGYRYTTAGNIAQKTSEDGEFSYQYDRTDRLTQAFPSQELRDKGLPIESYAYDKVGNRLGSSHQPGEWLYGSDNRLLQMGYGDSLTQFSYTANGHIATETTANGVREYSYDASDRLVSVQSNGVEIARYQHDPFGRRISKTVHGETTWYLYSDEGLIAELDGTGKMLVAYGWQPDTMFGTAPLWQANIAPEQTLQTAPAHYLYTDHLGTPIMAANSQGQVTWKGQHEAFGKAVADEANQIVMNLRFPGQYYDSETDSHYNYMRDYNPELGRYQQRDPIGLMGGINLYSYVKSNPNFYIDPFGLAKKNPNGAECIELKNKINRKKAELDHRWEDLDRDILKLPERFGPNERLAQSKRGHRTMINKEDSSLRKLENKYDDDCGGPGSPVLSSANIPSNTDWDVIAGVTLIGAGVVACVVLEPCGAIVATALGTTTLTLATQQ